MADENDDRIREAAKLLGTLFISRRDVKAVEFDGGWTPDRTKFTLGDFREHLSGSRCLGTYLLDEDNNVRFFAFDIDLKRKCPYYRMVGTANNDDVVLDLEPSVGNVEAGLHNSESPTYPWARVILMTTVAQISGAVKTVLGLQTLNVVTGGGAHVLVPFGGIFPAVEARELANSVMESLNHWERKNENFWVPERIHPDPPGHDPEWTHYSREVEIFPKQDELKSDGLGNLIRLPFGIHKKTGIRTYALADTDYESETMKLHKLNSLEALRGIAESLRIEA